MKNCTKCLKTKELSEFYFNKAHQSYRTKCKECILARMSTYYVLNSSLIKHKRQLSYRKDPLPAKKASQRWRLLNLHTDKHNKHAYHKLQMKINPQYKLAHSLRIRLKKAMMGNHKSGSAVRDLGCSIADFKIHLTSQFCSNLETGEMMTWDNHGLCGWHIDHIKPLSSFDLSDREQLLEAAHYTNQQPLWWKDNLRKGGNNGIKNETD